MNLGSIFEKPITFHQPALPSLEPLIRKKNIILDRWPDVAPMPAEKDRERLVQEMRWRLETDQWDDTPMSFVISAARALFDAERRTRADLSGLRDFYYAEIESSTRRVFLNSMLSVYLESYEPKATHTIRLASALTNARPLFGAQGQQLLANIPELLDPVKAPSAIATKMMGMSDCWNSLGSGPINSF